MDQGKMLVPLVVPVEAEPGAVEELWTGGELLEYHQDNPQV